MKQRISRYWESGTEEHWPLRNGKQSESWDYLSLQLWESFQASDNVEKESWRILADSRGWEDGAKSLRKIRRLEFIGQSIEGCCKQRITQND